MSRTILLSAILVVCVAAPIQAAPKLLVEFTHQVFEVEFSDPLPAAVPLAFDAFDPIFSLTYVDWQENYGPSDVGMTFIAPAEIVAGANQAIASPTARYRLETGPANFSDERTLGLQGHAVTSVERIVDRLVISRTQGEFYILDAAQRIQIWGHLIPEPNAIVLFVMAIAYVTLPRFWVRDRPKGGSRQIELTHSIS